MNNQKDIERRNYAFPVTVTAEDEKRTVEGYALLFDTASDGLSFVEIIERGALEGVKVIFFTLIPMFVGTLMGNFIIKHTPQPVPVYDVYGHVIDVPQENLFLIAGFLVLITLVPLYFAAKEHNKRIA